MIDINLTKATIVEDSGDFENLIMQMNRVPEGWLTVEDNIDYSQANGMEQVINAVKEAIGTKKKIGLIVDSDADGMSSATQLIFFLREFGMEPRLYHHPNKEHGYPSLELLKEQMGEDIEFIIVSDAGTNDIERHKEYIDNGVASVVLDHHDVNDIDMPHLVPIVNYFAYKKPAECENPNLSGSSIVYKFIESYLKATNNTNDELLKKCIPFAALGTIADVMNIGDLGTKGIVNKAFSTPIAELPQFFQVVNEADGRLARHNYTHMNAFLIGWYVAPFINAVIRTGSREERQEALELMIGDFSYHDSIAKYYELFKLKSKQDSKKKTTVENMIVKASINGKLNGKIFIGELPNDVPKTMTGVIAGEIANLLGKPTIIGRTYDSEDGTKNLSGSARVPNNFPLNDFRAYCEETGLVNFAAGHASAFGISLPSGNVQQFKNMADEVMPESVISYNADIVLLSKISYNIIIEMAKIIKKFANHWCRGFREPLISMLIPTSEIVGINLIGKNSNVAKVELANGLELIKFKNSAEELEFWKALIATQEEQKFIQVVGNLDINEWNGTITPQLKLDAIKEINL